MEKGEIFNPTPQLPEALSVDKIPENKKPTDADWEYIQGGKPEIVFENGNDKACKVIHNYINDKDDTGTGVVVPTSLSIVDNWKIKTAYYTIKGRCVGFPIAMLWKFHGKPCETSSKTKGGTKYERIEVKV